MTLNLVSKRIIIPIPAENLQNAQIGLKMVMDNLGPYLVNLSVEEKRAMMKMGSKSIDFVSKDLTYATTNPQFQPAFFDLDAFTTSFTAYGVVRSLQQPVSQLADMLDDTGALAGHGSMGPALAYYQSVKMAAKLNLPGAATIADDLGARFAAYGPRSTSKATSEA